MRETKPNEQACCRHTSRVRTELQGAPQVGALRQYPQRRIPENARATMPPRLSVVGICCWDRLDERC